MFTTVSSQLSHRMKGPENSCPLPPKKIGHSCRRPSVLERRQDSSVQKSVRPQTTTHARSSKGMLFVSLQVLKNLQTAPLWLFGTPGTLIYIAFFSLLRSMNAGGCLAVALRSLVRRRRLPEFDALVCFWYWFVATATVYYATCSASTCQLLFWGYSVIYTTIYYHNLFHILQKLAPIPFHNPNGWPQPSKKMIPNIPALKTAMRNHAAVVILRSHADLFERRHPHEFQANPWELTRPKGSSWAPHLKTFWRSWLPCSYTF